MTQFPRIDTSTPETYAAGLFYRLACFYSGENLPEVYRTSPRDFAYDTSADLPWNARLALPVLQAMWKIPNFVEVNVGVLEKLLPYGLGRHENLPGFFPMTREEWEIYFEL